MPNCSTYTGGRPAATAQHKAASKTSSPTKMIAGFLIRPPACLRAPGIQHNSQEHTMYDPIVLVSVARTPMGSMLGSLSGLAAHELGAIVINAAVERAGLDGTAVNEARSEEHHYDLQ